MILAIVWRSSSKFESCLIPLPSLRVSFLLSSSLSSSSPRPFFLHSFLLILTFLSLYRVLHIFICFTIFPSSPSQFPFFFCIYSSSSFPSYSSYCLLLPPLSFSSCFFLPFFLLLRFPCYFLSQGGSRIFISGGGGGGGGQKIMCALAHHEREARSPLRPGSRAHWTLEALGGFLCSLVLSEPCF